jgi:hypothetical protein
MVVQEFLVHLALQVLQALVVQLVQMVLQEHLVLQALQEQTVQAVQMVSLVIVANHLPRVHLVLQVQMEQVV